MTAVGPGNSKIRSPYPPADRCAPFATLETGSIQAHTRRMSEHRPTFVARKNPGFGWVIDVLWPDGETEVIKGFPTEKEATEWVAKHSESWQEDNN